MQLILCLPNNMDVDEYNLNCFNDISNNITTNIIYYKCITQINIIEMNKIFFKIINRQEFNKIYFRLASF